MVCIQPKPLACGPAACRTTAGSKRPDPAAFARSREGLCGTEGLEALVCQP